MQVGIDIVDIRRIAKIFSKSPGFLGKILHPEEMDRSNVQTLCGKIAAKEAIIKTGYMDPGDWKKVKIINAKTGQPLVFDQLSKPVTKLNISISHTSSHAIAVAIYEN